MRALGGSQLEVINLSDKLQLFWSQNGDVARIGLIDLEQGRDIAIGKSRVLMIKGEFEIESVRSVVVTDGQLQKLSPMLVGARTAGDLGGVISFEQNYPNPFNPETNFSFYLPLEAHVTIEIYNILGQRVITLADEVFTAGRHTLGWNSRDESGATVASGIYFSKFVSGNFVARKKMAILK